MSNFERPTERQTEQPVERAAEQSNKKRTGQPTEKELAEAYFSALIVDPAAQPDPALPPATARLIRELVSAEKAASPVDAPDFAAISRRIRRNVRPPANSPAAPTVREGRRAVRPVPYETGRVAVPPSRAAAWPKFLALAGMAATIVLVAGLLVLSLVEVRSPGPTPTAGFNPASRPTETAPVLPPFTPTAAPQPSPTVKPADDALNPKRFLPKALEDAAKGMSLDPQALDKELQGGQSLAEIAKKQGLPLEKIRKLLLDSFTAQIDTEKAAGQLTSTQADDLYKLSGAFIDDFLNNQQDPSAVKVTPTPAKKG